MKRAVQNVSPSRRGSRIGSFEMNLKRVYLPMLIAGWISGFGIIEYPLGHTRSIISILYALVIYGSLLIGNICIMYSVLLRTFHEDRNSSSGLYYIICCMAPILMFYIVILHWINQKKMKSCLRRLAEIKMEMKQLECNDNDIRAVTFQKNEILIVTIVLSLHILQLIGNNLKVTNISWIVVIYAIMFIFHVFSSWMNDVIFINYVVFIKWEFMELNEKMTQLFSELEEKLSMENSNDSLEQNAQNYCDSIKTIRRLHLQLVKLSRRVNNVYGVQILCSLIISIVLLIANLYNVYSTVKELTNDNELIVNLILKFILVPFPASKILAINLACAHTIDEAHEIGYVNMKFNIEAINERMELETRLFTMQLLQNPVNFTADGYFDLGYSCILLVIGIIITYLSLLIDSVSSAVTFESIITKFFNETTE